MQNSSGGALALQVDSDGNVRYDILAKRGHEKDRHIQSQYKDLVPLNQRSDMRTVSLDRPSEEEVQATADKTRAALETLVQGKIKAAQPKNVKTEDSKSQYFRFTPNSANGNNQQRIIKMVEKQQDPMEPPKFKAKKVPRGPPSPPAPILHSPPRKVTAKEQADWMIPPCVSNWKNPKGYTIPLDKRLAADGRGLDGVQINDKFATVTEALSLADRYARDEIRQRALMQQKLAQREKLAKEETLRALAQKAREERSGVTGRASRDDSEDSAGSESDDEQAEEREELRRERRRDRERDLRISRMGAEQRAKVLAREQNRDISEKIALGLAKPTTTKESMYDARLFNQNEGLNAGFGDDDNYNVYDKKLFAGSSAAAAIYSRARPTDNDGGDDKLTEEDVNDMLSKDRFGTLGTGSHRGLGQGEPSDIRDGPVQFEKDSTDPFQQNVFFDSVNKGVKRNAEGGSSSERKRQRD